MLTTDTAYGISCDVCSTRLDLATRGISGTDIDQATVRRLAQRLEWRTFTRADRDVCRSCVNSEAGRRTIAAFADDGDDTEITGPSEPGPHIAPSQDPGGEPAKVVPSGEPAEDPEERQNSDEPFPGEPREVQPQEERGYARLEGAAV